MFSKTKYIVLVVVDPHLLEDLISFPLLSCSVCPKGQGPVEPPLQISVL